MIDRLPLELLATLESLDDTNNILQSSQVWSQFSLDLCLVVTQLLVECLAVWASTQSSRKDGLYEEAVVRLQRYAVCVPERVSELLGLLGHVLAQCNTRKVQTTAYTRLV